MTITHASTGQVFPAGACRRCGAREREAGCDTCGAKINRDGCLNCGAPQCCPQCCQIDLLKAEVGELKGQIIDAQAGGYESGFLAAKSGEQVVHADLDSGVDDPICKIVWYEDRGDPSVGLAGWSGWILVADQSGTELSRLRDAGTRLEGLREALIAVCDFCALRYPLDPTDMQHYTNVGVVGECKGRNLHSRIADEESKGNERPADPRITEATGD